MLNTWRYKIINENGQIESGKIQTDMSASEICLTFERFNNEIIYLKRIDLIPQYSFIIPLLNTEENAYA